MKNHLLPTLSSLLALVVVAPSAVLPDGSAKPPLDRYASLWTNSLLTEKPLKVMEDPAAEKKNGGQPEQSEEIQPEKQPTLAEWLRKHEPKPTTAPDAQTNLVEFLRGEAKRNGLRLRRMNLQTTVHGRNYDRARIGIEVSGKEEPLYRWLDRLQSPEDFRAVTYFRINPTRDDVTQVDCRIVVEQWFIPEDAEEAKAKPGLELTPLVEGSHYPIALMFHLSKARPPGGIRFKRVEIYNQLTDDGLVRSLQVIGDARKLADANTFNKSLRKEEGLKGYVWNTPAPTGSKMGTWLFMFGAQFSPKK